MGIDYDHLRNILATAIRDACPDKEDPAANLYPIWAAETTDGVVTHVEAEVDALVEVIIKTLDEERFAFRPFVARSGWVPWRMP